MINRTRTDLLARLSQDDTLRRDDAEAYARVMAEGLNGLYGYLDWQATQYLPDLAAQEGVERWASMLGEWYTDATAASGQIPVVGTIGASISLTARWQNTAGVLYKPVASVVLASSPQLIDVQCEVTGVAGNLGEGELLTLISPVAGVQSQSAVPESGIQGGDDQEDVEGLRAKVLLRLREPPQGGSEADYLRWALAAHPSVTRAWVYPGEQGAGTVVVRVVCDDLSDPIPTPQVVAAVQSYINQRRPVTSEATALAPVADAIPYTIALEPDTPEVRARVASALADLHRRDAEPGGTLRLSRISEAISLAEGETSHVLSVPAADVVMAVGHFPVLGAITWA